MFPNVLLFCWLMRKISVLVFFASTFILWWYGFWVYANPELWTSLITATVANLNAELLVTQVNPFNKQEIVSVFCKSLSPESTTGFSTMTESYDASQSIFLALLCNNNKLQSSFFRQQLSEYIEMNSFKDLIRNKACYKEYLEDCNLVELSDVIMMQLFSELFTLKQAEIFWLSQSHLWDKTLLLSKINSFAKEKFWIDKFCDDPNHKYPKTCNIMERNMKAFIPKIAKFKIINAKKLYALAKNKKANENLEQCGSSYDFLLCGTIGDTTRGLKPFISLLYNELARYTIFMTYYTTVLNERDTISFAVKDELVQYPYNQTKLFFLTNQTLNDLVSLARTFPIHIGLLAYQEDLLRFRDAALSKIVTPFYTLYHKLRNVQTNS